MPGLVVATFLVPFTVQVVGCNRAPSEISPRHVHGYGLLVSWGRVIHLIRFSQIPFLILGFVVPSDFKLSLGAAGHAHSLT